MCTAMTLQNVKGEGYFGRTMDFSFPLDPALYIVPGEYEWNNALHTNVIQNRYSFIGAGQELGQPLSRIIFADGVNEQGFAAAMLYFPGFAKYDDVQTISGEQTPSGDRRMPVGAIELVSFLLGQCASVSHAASVLRQIRIAGVEDPVTGTAAPLHWILCDRSGDCAVAEQTEKGLNLYLNPIGVLSNSPDFPWHMTNLRNYIMLSNKQVSEAGWGDVILTPFGQGGGTVGLPGDFTPPSRFVRTAFMKTHMDVPQNKKEAVVAGFHVLEGVSIPRGVVVTENGRADVTQYTSFMSLETGEYYFTTYDNREITMAKLDTSQIQGTEPVMLGKMNRPVRFFRLKD